MPSPIACPGSALSLAADPSELRAAGRALARLELVAGPLETPCWVYTGCLSGSGYACIRAGGNPVLVHRLLYRVLVGPIPAGLELHHRCERPSCSNPGHLVPVTHAQNHAYTRRARADRCARGHRYTPANTLLHGEYRTRMCRRCSRDYKRRARGLDENAIVELERTYQERIAA